MHYAASFILLQKQFALFPRNKLICVPLFFQKCQLTNEGCPLRIAKKYPCPFKGYFLMRPEPEQKSPKDLRALSETRRFFGKPENRKCL